ncbi:MAG: hypothetical protein ACK56I_03285, partial [bacterium]
PPPERRSAARPRRPGCTRARPAPRARIGLQRRTRPATRRRRAPPTGPRARRCPLGLRLASRRQRLRHHRPPNRQPSSLRQSRPPLQRRRLHLRQVAPLAGHGVQACTERRRVGGLDGADVDGRHGG